jgi:hypothetical protein
MNRVTGNSTTRKTMNGTARKTATTTDRPRLKRGFESWLSGAVTVRTIASTSPMVGAISAEAPTMVGVCRYSSCAGRDMPENLERAGEVDRTDRSGIEIVSGHRDQPPAL